MKTKALIRQIQAVFDWGLQKEGLRWHSRSFYFGLKGRFFLTFWGSGLIFRRKFSKVLFDRSFLHFVWLRQYDRVFALLNCWGIKFVRQERFYEWIWVFERRYFRLNGSDFLQWFWQCTESNWTSRMKSINLQRN